MLSLYKHLPYGIRNILGGGASPLGDINRGKILRSASCFHLNDKANTGVKILRRYGLDFEMIQIQPHDSCNS